MSLKFPAHKAKSAIFTTLLLFAVCGIVPHSAIAQEPALDLPVTSSAERNSIINNEEITHPPLRLTPDKSSIVTLDRSAGSIIIGNPAHLNIMADSANRLIVVPRAPGASFFTVLDKDGALLMQRHVIVASPKEKYLRVRNTCAAGTDCQPTNVYYCPDMCHEIMMDSDLGASGGSGVPSQITVEQQLMSTRQNTSNTSSENSDLPPPPPESTDISE